MKASTSTSYDFCVAGAGVFGSWIAYTLRRRGARVLLVDPYGPGNSRASSGGETRIIRMTYGNREIYTRWSQQSLVLWKELFARTGENLFVPSGALFTAPRDSAYLASSREALTRAGVAFESLESAGLGRRFPHLKLPKGEAGILEPDSGVLLARRAVQAVVREAIAAGVELRREPLTADSRRRIKAGTFVFACGPWLPALFPDIIGPRIRPTRQAVLFFGTPRDQSAYADMPAWVRFDDGVYTLPDIENRGFKLAIDTHGPRFDPESGSRIVSEAEIETGRAALRRYFPALANAPLVESRVCQYENTSSGDFLIDRHPRLRDTWIIGGGSGHGFKHGPMMGEYVASLLLDGRDQEPLFALAAKSTRFRRVVH